MERFNKLISTYKKYQMNNPVLQKQMISYLLSLEEFDSEEIYLDVLHTYIFIDEIREKHALQIMQKIELGIKKYNGKAIKIHLIDNLGSLNPQQSCINLFYLFNQEYKKSNSIFILDKKEFLDICHKRLKTYIEEGEDILIAFDLFYSCWDYVDNENNVHLTSESIRIIRDFINKVPAELYLKFLVRNKYTHIGSMQREGLFDFVFEPFTENIFDNWESFRIFLTNLKTNQVTNQILVNSILDFLEFYQTTKFSVITITREQLSQYRTIPAVNQAIEFSMNQNH